MSSSWPRLTAASVALAASGRVARIRPASLPKTARGPSATHWQPSTIRSDDSALRPPSLYGLALALAHCGCLFGRSAQCGGRRRLIPSFSRHVGNENAAHSSQRHQHGGSLARSTHLHRRLPPGHSQKSAPGFPMALAGLLGGTAGALVLLNTPQKTFLHLVPWLLLVAASIFAVSGPVSRWLERRNAITVVEPPEARARCTPPCCRFSRHHRSLLLHWLLRRRGRVPHHHLALALRLPGPERNQCPQSGIHHHGQRHRVLHLRRGRPGGLALLPAWPWLPAPSAATPPPAWLAGFRNPCCAASSSSSASPWPHGSSGKIRNDRCLNSPPPLMLNWIGSVAAFCTTLSFLPQLIRVWRRKSARHLIDYVSAFQLWRSLLAGLWLGHRLGPIAAANAVTLRWLSPSSYSNSATIARTPRRRIVLRRR